jgi:hypothetical protein
MPVFLLAIVLLIAGCLLGAARTPSEDVPTADAPFTRTATDVGQSTFRASAVALVHLGAASSVFALAGPAAAAVLRIARIGAHHTGGPDLPESSLLLRATIVAALVIGAIAARGLLRRTRS